MTLYTRIRFAVVVLLIGVALLVAWPAVVLADGASVLSDTIDIVIDDFVPQPLRSQPADDPYYYNRIGGNRGALFDADIGWGVGAVTLTVAGGHSQGGMWMSLNHPTDDDAIINFSSIVPSSFSTRYHSRATELHLAVREATPDVKIVVELKDLGPVVRWRGDAECSGGSEVLSFDLPRMENISELVLFVDDSEAGEYCIIDEITLTVTNPITDPAEAAYVWSLAQWVHNWDPDSGMVRDRAGYRAGEFDAVQATGALAAGVAQAVSLGVMSREEAVWIVNQSANALMNDVPRMYGLWPHFCRLDGQGDLEIMPGTEWSSVDTAIAAMGLYLGQTALGLDATETMAFMRAIEWDRLIVEGEGISHGYATDGTPLTATWDWFGGESWLLAFTCAAASGTIPPIASPVADTTYNGSGFIDELAWLFIPPPPNYDVWGAPWYTYRREAADWQITYMCREHPGSCLCQLDLFGLSAAEVPVPSMVTPTLIYQPFGVGGEENPNDGTGVCGQPVVVPHYSAMIASLRPDEAIDMWDWLIDEGPFSPLNNVESLMFVGEECGVENLRWNELRGSWNLALQTLGWGRYLERRTGHTPVLYRATLSDAVLATAYRRMVPPVIHLPLVLH